MSLDPRELLNATRPGGARGPGDPPVNVELVLKSASLDQGTRERLEGLGLSIAAVVRNKVFGRAPANCLDAIRGDAGVEDVRTSVRLEPKPSRGRSTD